MDTSCHGLAGDMHDMGMDQQLRRLSVVLQTHTGRITVDDLLDWICAELPHLLLWCFFGSSLGCWTFRPCFPGRGIPSTSGDLHDESEHQVLAAHDHTGCHDWDRGWTVLYPCDGTHGDILLQQTGSCDWDRHHGELSGRYHLPCDCPAALAQDRIRLDGESAGLLQPRMSLSGLRVHETETTTAQIWSSGGLFGFQGARVCLFRCWFVLCDLAYLLHFLLCKSETPLVVAHRSYLS